MKKYILLIVALLSAAGTLADVDKTTLNNQNFLVGKVDDGDNHTAYFSVDKTGSGNYYQSLSFTADTVVIPETIKYVDNSTETPTEIVYKIIGVKNLCFNRSHSKIVILPDNATSLSPTGTNNSTSYPGYVTGVKTIILSKNINTIENYSYSNNWSVKRFEVAEGNTTYSADDMGVLYNANKSTLLYAPYGNQSEFIRYTIPSTVTVIGNSAFYNFTYLERVTVEGDNLKEIGTYAFYGCSNLMEFISSNASLEKIGSQAFNNNNTKSKLNTFTFSNTIKEIGQYAFYYAKFDNSEFTLPGNVEKIGTYAFYEAFNGNLQKLIIPASLETKLKSDKAYTGDYIFKSISNVYSYIRSPQNINGSIFSNYPGVIYIPTGSMSTYISKTGWSNWSSRYQESIDLIPDDQKTTTPVITYNEADSTITITNGKTDETIYYTTDGSAPTTASTKYTAKFAAKKNMVINAIAYKEGLIQTSSSLNVDWYKVDVTITTYAKGANLFVKLTPSEKDVTIKYTKDGSNPNDENNSKAKTYTEPFSVNDEVDEYGNTITSTVCVYATKNGYTTGEYTPFDSYNTGGYYVSNDNVRCAAPIAATSTKEDGTKVLTWSSTTPGAVIYYTVGGMNETPADPDTTKSTTYKFEKEIVLSANNTYKAMALSSDKLPSNVTTQKINFFKAPKPTISYKAYYDKDGKLTTKAVVTGSGQAKETLWYRKNMAGDVFSQYTQEVPINDGEYFEAQARYPDWNNSDYDAGYFYTYTITCETPQFGINVDERQVTISSTTEGATIYYVLKSLDDVAKSDTIKYTGVITLDGNYRIQTYAAKADMINSATSEKVINDWYNVENVTFTQSLDETGTQPRMSLTTTTEGAKIYYGVGSYDYDIIENNKEYLGKPIAVDDGVRVWAIAVKENYNNSSWTYQNMDYSQYEDLCDAPTINVDRNARQVTITSSVADSKIFYTTDGSTPTALDSLLYTGAFSPDVNCTIKAIVTAEGKINSRVSSASVSDWFRVGDVKFTPVMITDGTNTQYKVTLSSSTEGSTIYYALDNYDYSTPANNILYNGKDSININVGQYIYAIALKEGFDNSNWNSFYASEDNYTVSRPQFTSNSDDKKLYVTSTEGATIYYTLDGVDPTTASSVYNSEEGITPNGNVTVKAMAVKSGMKNSEINEYKVSNWYRVSNIIVDFYVEDNVLKAKLSTEDKEPDAKIYYSKGGYYDFNTSDYTLNAEYTGPFEVSDGACVSAGARKSNYTSSYVTKTYAYYSNYTCSMPEITARSADSTVVMTCSTEDAVIYYTNDGTDPTISEKNKYTAGTIIKLDRNRNFKAIAVKDKWFPSSISENNIASWFKCKTVNFEQVLDGSQPKMKLTSPDGGTIYYNYNGYYSDLENNTVYSGKPIAVDPGQIVYAFVKREGYNDSEWAYKNMDYTSYETYSAPTITENSDKHLVTITTSVEDGKIYYTTDGTTPIEADSLLYTEPIMPELNCTIKAIVAGADSIINSPVSSYSISWYYASAVTFDPTYKIVDAEKEYRVCLKTDTKDADIYYGVDSRDYWNPENNLLYTPGDTIVVNAEQYVYAIAVKKGYNNSDWREFFVSDNNYKAKTPSVTEDKDNNKLFLSSSDGASIYYTIDGTTPDSTSVKYTDVGVSVEANITLKAIAYKDGMYDSDVSNYTVNNWFRVGEVTITPYVENNKLMVKITTETPGAAIYYNLNDWKSNTSTNIPYTAPFEINESNNGSYIYAGATKKGYVDAEYTYYSNIYLSSYTSERPSATLLSDKSLVITAGENATVYYTLDGTEPTTNSTKYTAQFKPDRNFQLRTFAVEIGKITSSVYSYDYSGFQVDYPQITLDGTKMTITTTTPNATIYYSVGDENQPSENANKYIGPFTIADNRVVKAIAMRDGWTSSGINQYTPYDAVKCPQVKQTSFDGHYMTLGTVDGATIYYTLDGTMPERYVSSNHWDSNLGYWVDDYSYRGTEYKTKISIDETCTVIARAFHPYMTQSDTIHFDVNSFAGETGATSVKAGGLEASMGWADDNALAGITEFEILGPVNSDDLAFINKKMTSLQNLDLSKAETTSLPNNAFAGMPLVWFSSPNGLTSVGNKLFSNCKNLAAVEWNTKQQIPDDAFDNDVNPNLLLYLADAGAEPNKTPVRNIIKNGTAQNITLSDGENNNFYCPTEFQTENISYTHEFTLESGNGYGWETIVLPFDCKDFVHEESNSVLKPFAEYNEMTDKGQNKPFWLRQLTISGFEDVKSIEANVPYAICMPNNASYATRYRISGKVTFSANQKVIVHASTEDKSAVKGASTFHANYLNNADTQNLLVLNTEDTDDYRAGSRFVLNSGRALRPFEAYVTSTVRARAYVDLTRGFTDDPDGDENTTAIKVVEPDDDGMVKVYNLSGVLVKQGTKEDAMRGLAKGVYIMNGKRVIVK